MPFTLSKANAQHLAGLLGPVAKFKRLDGAPTPATLRVADGTLYATVVPDVPRVTAVRVRLEDVDGEGSVTLEAQRLIDILRRVSDDVQVSATDDLVQFGNWQTPTVDHIDPPDIESDSVTVPRDEFIRGLSKVSWAISKDLVRPRLTIARFDRGFARASDGLRYCECRVGFEQPWEVSGFLTPLLNRYFEAGGEHLHLAEDARHQSYDDGALRLYCPRQSSEYLDLDALVAEPARAHNHFLLRVRREEILAAVRDASIMTDDAAIVSWDLTGDRIIVSAQDGLNRAEVAVDCSWTGEQRRLRFFVRPLLQLLRVSDRENLELRLGTSTLRKLTPLVVWEDGVFALVNQVRSGG